MRKYVNHPVEKTDAMALVTGKPVYVNDIAPKDCLIVKVLRSPHAHALIREIDVQKAFLVPGVEAVYTYWYFLRPFYFRGTDVSGTQSV